MSFSPILIVFLVAAVVCYMMGSAYGAFSLFILGMVFELAFWLKLVKKDQAKDKNTLLNQANSE